ncbi:hypothetical protein I4U23_020175 [Adineta vaga]|nr:hypothetical protein I4U23_020175 [Adineta vaga]
MANPNDNFRILRRLALLIGNDNYEQEQNKLNQSIKNATDLEQSLEKIKFKSTAHYDVAKHETMLENIITFTKTIQDGDLILFFFSGHSCQIDGTNYLINTGDDRISSGEDVAAFGTPLDRVIGRLRDTEASYMLVMILDCCRQYRIKNESKSAFQARRKGLSKMKASDKTLIQYACAANKTNPNNLYMECLLRNIVEENVNIVDIIQRITDEVTIESDERQRPFITHRLRANAEIFFNEILYSEIFIPRTAEWKSECCQRKKSPTKRTKDRTMRTRPANAMVSTEICESQTFAGGRNHDGGFGSIMNNLRSPQGLIIEMHTIKTVKAAIFGENPKHFLRYDDPSVEHIEDDEEEKISAIIASFRSMQEKNYEKHGHALRGTHTKTQALVRGTLTVPADLLPHLSQGLFIYPGKYPVILRYASEPTQIEDDRIPALRGLGMKVFNVIGSKLREDENQNTQDFFFNNTPVLELQNATVCRDIQCLRNEYFNNLEGLKKALKQRNDSHKQLARTELPNTNIMGQEMYSQAAYRYGDYVVKYALFPVAKEQLAIKSQKVKETDPPTILCDWIKEYFHHHSAKYEFRVQFCSDITLQPVEDASIEWSQHAAPFHTVATLDIPQQDAFDAEFSHWWQDNIRLYAWAGLKEHRPLGSINRIRKRLYDASSAFRAEKNNQPVTFPQSINDVPATKHTS